VSQETACSARRNFPFVFYVEFLHALQALAKAMPGSTSRRRHLFQCLNGWSMCDDLEHAVAHRLATPKHPANCLVQFERPTLPVKPSQWIFEAAPMSKHIGNVEQLGWLMAT
jgi:hypothetical protein